MKDEELSKTEAGTTIYYAPEMVLREGYGKEIDLWTIGIFAYEMSNYNPPFPGPDIKDRQRVKRLVKAAENNQINRRSTIQGYFPLQLSVIRIGPSGVLSCS